MKTYGLEAAADFLHIGKTTLLALAGKGIVPGAKIGREWVFSDEGLENYLRTETEKQTAKRSGSVEGMGEGVRQHVPTAMTRVRRRPAPPPSLSMTGED
jgi:hypothetical protein